MAALAMVALVALGVVSAALFTGSACGALEPEAVAVGRAGTDVEAVLSEATGARADESGVGSDGLLGLESPVLVGAADVGEADGLTPVDGGLVATGARLSLLPAPGEAARAVEVGASVRVVGSGSALYALALANEPTGRVDGIVPVDADLSAGECDDTARVGQPLAFHLAAADGDLLLFRVADDAEDPELELRGADGVHWTVPIELGAGAPGGLAEGLGGAVGDELVVTARRSSPEGTAPGVQARDRGTGDLRWSLAPSVLVGLAPGGDGALETAVVGVTEELVLLTLSREDRSRALVVGVEAGDGTTRWTSDLDVAGRPALDTTEEDGLVLLAPRRAADDADGLTQELVRVDPETGSASTLYASPGERAHAAAVGASVVVAVDATVTIVSPDDAPATVETGAPVLDVQAVEERAAVLLDRDGTGVVVWLDLRGGF